MGLALQYCRYWDVYSAIFPCIVTVLLSLEGSNPPALPVDPESDSHH